MNHLREEPGLINTANTCYCANTFYLMEVELALFFIWCKVWWQFFFKKFTPVGHQQPALIFPCWQQEIWMGSFFFFVHVCVGLGGVRWWKEQNCMKEWKDFLIPNHLKYFCIFEKFQKIWRILQKQTCPWCFSSCLFPKWHCIGSWWHAVLNLIFDVFTVVLALSFKCFTVLW